MKFFILIAWGLWLVLMAGWLTHRSHEPSLGPWTVGYVCFLIVAASGCLVPLFLHRLTKRLGNERAQALVLRGVAILMAFWLLASKVHQGGQQFDFDPWLQIAPATPMIPVSREPGVARILFLGGSTTRGPNLPTDSRYPDLVGQALEQAGFRVETINAGMYWYTTRHSHITWSTHWRRWQPDVVVVMHAFNDLVRSFVPAEAATGEYRSDWSHFYGPAIHAARPPTFESWLLTDRLSFLTEAWGSSWRTQWTPVKLEGFRSKPTFDESLDWLVQDLKRDGGSPVLVTQPHRFAAIGESDLGDLWTTRRLCVVKSEWGVSTVPDMPSMDRAMRAFNESVRTVASDHSIPLVEAELVLPGDREHFDDAIHHKLKGVQVLARQVAGELIRHPALQSFKVVSPGP